MKFNNEDDPIALNKDDSPASLKKEIRGRIMEDYERALKKFEMETENIYKEKFSNISKRFNKVKIQIDNEESVLSLELKNMERLMIAIKNKKSELENSFSQTENLLKKDKESRLDFVKGCLEAEANRALEKNIYL